jgi:hypothetical protein
MKFMRAAKILFGVLCFGMGVAFATGAVHAFVHAQGFDNPFDFAIPAMFGSMLLLGSFLLLRR